MDRLNQAIKRRMTDRLDTQRILEWLHEAFDRLDQAPRHDTEFSETEARDLLMHACGPYASAFDAAIGSIERAVAQLRGGIAAIEGVFGGELRATLDDPMQRRLEELEILQGKFTAAWMKYRRPSKPFEIRHQNLITILLRFNTELKDLVDLRVCFRSETCTESNMRLHEAEQILRRIRSQMAKCRDNPSQKMGRQAKGWCEGYARVRQLLDSVRSKDMYDYLRAGKVYGSRASFVTAMWLPSMEGADPWTFDPFPYMDTATAAEQELIEARRLEVCEAHRRARQDAASR